MYRGDFDRAVQTLQFLRGLHFIEGTAGLLVVVLFDPLQFLRGLHFIEGCGQPIAWDSRDPPCSSFGDCTSLRVAGEVTGRVHPGLAVPSGTALH